MQKKSLLVALFCGALCLTGCLKNEESASVAQVRIAKANELNSIADLNKAKAQAEVIYANAEATIANAEAKLREAQANLVNAQAETEKVQAELLKVQVQLAEVVVDEEKVKLQLLEADLQKHLAEVQAAVAKAEAEKQEYINALESAIAQADVDAVNNALALLKAENAVEEYLLTLAEDKAEAAEAASEKYFAAQRTVQALQTQQLQIRAEKALVEAGAIEVRDAIHYAIDKLDEEIAEKEEIVAYLKEHQSMTPEEAEAALKEARAELEAAFNAYAAALEAENDAKGAYQALEAKTALFEEGWEQNFTNFIKTHWGRQGHRHFRTYVREKGFAEYEGFDDVMYFGYNDRTDRSKFIKLWKVEQTDSNPVAMYPEKTVDWFFPTYDEKVFAPAEIYYENIEAVLDSIADRDKARVAKEVEHAKKISAKNVETWTATVGEYADTLGLIQQYVDARKDTIAKYEADLAALVEAYNTSAGGHATAQQAYYEYMVVNYDIPRGAFEAEIIAAADTAKYSTAYYAAKSAKEDAEAAEVDAKKDTTTAGTNLAEAKALYEAAVEEAAADWATYDQSYIDAFRDWSPVFEGTYKKVAKGKGNDGLSYYQWKRGEHKVDVPLHVGTTEKFDTTATTQRTWLSALDSREGKHEVYEAAKISYAAGLITEQQLNDAKNAYKQDSINVKNAEAPMLVAEVVFEALQDKYDEIWGNIEEGAYNPDFADVTFENRDAKGLKYDKDNDEWYIAGTPKKVAGTAQAAKFMADSLLKVAQDSVASKTTKFNTAATPYNSAMEGWTIASGRLKQAFAEAKKDYKADPKVAELYAAYKKAPETVEKVNAQWTELKKRYGIQGSVTPNFSYQAPDDPYTYPMYGGGMNWLRSNFNLNPDYEYIYGVTEENGKLVIKKQAVTKRGGAYARSNSLSVKKADLAKRIANEPTNLQKTIDGIENSDEVQQLKKDIADVKAALEVYKGYESEYKDWVAEREEAFQVWQDSRKTSFEAMVDEFEAKSAYKATETLANGGLWVYDPDKTIFYKVYGDTAPVIPNVNRSDDFTWITVNEEIARLEGTTDVLHEILGNLIVTAITGEGEMPDFEDFDIEDLDKLGISPDSIAGLSFAKKLLQEVLKQGKISLQVVLASYDEELAMLDEQIDLYTKLAAIYKGIMNANLGIVEESEGETGPLDGEGEGDDEE